MTQKTGPLKGMRVIELAHIMAGPVCGLMLADMGADVIKVEKPAGDDSRRFVPPEIEGESAAYMMMNRNKRAIALDLKTEAGRQVLRTLVERADVAEIGKPGDGALELYDLIADPHEKENIAAANPGLVKTLSADLKAWQASCRSHSRQIP